MPEAAFADRYEIFVRSPRTLEVIGELRPQDIPDARWTRMQFEPGPWSLQIPRVKAEAASASAGTNLIARQNLIEIRRDGEREFVGMILNRLLEPHGVMWTLGGFDLLHWLSRRYVGSTTAVAKNGAAETVLKEYVEENLGATAGTIAGRSRAATDELIGKTFSIEADGGLGGAVEYQAQRALLSRVTADVCRQGDLLQEIVLTDAGLEYRVRQPVDATTGSGAAGTVFAVNMDNVEGLGYREAFTSVTNAILVAGSGVGDARTIREVIDEASAAQDFLCEGVLDQRAMTTNDQLDAAGAAEIARQLDAAIAADVVPLTVSENARYREDWDVGWDVTIAIPAAGVAAINRRIASASVTLTRAQGERIAFSLGVPKSRSTLRRVGDAIERLNRGAAV